MSNTNPFNSPIVGILLQNSDATTSLDIFQRNVECEYHRLELTESMFDVYPSGVLVVKDKSDLITRMNTFGVIYIQFLFENTQVLKVRIHSISNLNNAASATEESYIALHFSNYLYTYCQENSLSQIMQLTKPKVFRIDQFVKEVANKIGSIATQGTSYLDATDNYVMYRPFNPNMDGTEIASDDIAKYLNYVANYAVPLQNGPYGGYAEKPRYFFWTDWGSYLNFKFLSSVTDDTTELERYETNNFRYAIYNNDIPNQKFGDNFYKKIYNYSTNQGNQYFTKQYFYIRKTPKILDDISYDRGSIYPKSAIYGLTGNTYSRLAYQFLPEGEKYNIMMVGNTSGFNRYAAGAQELVYDGEWGFVEDAISNPKNSVASNMNSKYNTEPDYYRMIHGDGLTGAFNYLDNSEMWKNMFDLTPIDPYYPESQIGQQNAINSNLQKVIDVRHNSLLNQYGTGLSGSQSFNIRQQELLNFVKYVLCCIEDEDEDSFFAVLTQVSEDATSPSLGKKFLYGWNKILFTSTAGSLPNFTPNVINKMIGAGWTYDKTEYCDLTKVTDTDYKGKPAAINLNERGNTGTSSVGGYYIAPGWNVPPTPFTYRPIGFSTLNSGNVIKTPHVVKMYKKSITSLLRDSGDPFEILQDPDYESSYFYYFSVENVVDGECT